jgi:hypothetical protein
MKQSAGRRNQLESDSKDPGADEDYREDLTAAVLDDDEREIFIEAATANMSGDGLDQLSNFIISLREEINQEPLGAQHVRNELDLTLESLFKRSEAFRLALELYASRFHLKNNEVVVSGAELDEMLKAIKAANLDTPTDPYGWMQKLGDAVAGLYESLNRESFHNLASMVTDFVTDHAYSNDYEARALLPRGLKNALAHCQNPTLKVLYCLGQKELAIAEISEGDISENFKTLITGIGKICPITEDSPDTPFLLVELVRDDGKEFTFYKGAFPFEAINTLSDFIKERFGVEVAAEKEAKKPEQAKTANVETPPAWILRLSAAVAEALEDERLPEKVEDMITTMLTDLDNAYCSDFPSMAKTTLPISLYRACGFEPPAQKRPVSAEE